MGCICQCTTAYTRWCQSHINPLTLQNAFVHVWLQQNALKTKYLSIYMGTTISHNTPPFHPVKYIYPCATAHTRWPPVCSAVEHYNNTTHTYLSYTQEGRISLRSLFQPQPQTFMNNIQGHSHQKEVGGPERGKSHATELLAPLPMFCQTGASTKVQSRLAKGWGWRHFIFMEASIIWRKL